jgi:hypothetical protein
MSIKLKKILQETGGFYYVDGRIEEDLYKLLLDTGAKDSVFSSEFIPQDSEPTERALVHIVGRKEVAIRVDKPLIVLLGERKIELFPYFIDFSLFSLTNLFVGLLGFDFFHIFVHEIRFREEEIVLTNKRRKLR